MTTRIVCISWIRRDGPLPPGVVRVPEGRYMLGQLPGVPGDCVNNIILPEIGSNSFHGRDLDFVRVPSGGIRKGPSSQEDRRSAGCALHPPWPERAWYGMASGESPADPRASSADAMSVCGDLSR